MLPVAVAFMVGLVSGIYPVALALLLLLLIARPRAGLLIACVAMVAIGFLMGPRTPRLIEDRMEFAGDVRVVQAPRPTSRGERAIVQASGKKLIMYFDADQPVAWGDTLAVKGNVRPLSERMRAYWMHQEVAGELYISSRVTRVYAGPIYADWGQQIRRSFATWIETHLDRRAASIVQAVCFNHEAKITSEERDLLAKSGIIHIVSTSGMHVVLVAGMLAVILSVLPLPRWAQLAILFGLLILYGAASGFRPPMVRSMIMAGMFYVAYLFRREADGLSMTGASAIGTLVLMPAAIFDLGFLLSFACITAFVLFMPQEGSEPKDVAQWFWIRAKQILWGSGIATLAAAPLLALFFGEFSVVGPITNLLVVPVIPVLVAVSLGAWLISPLLPGLAEGILQGCVQPLALWVAGVSETFGRLPFASAQVELAHGLWAALFYGFALLLWKPKARPAPGSETSTRGTI